MNARRWHLRAFPALRQGGTLVPSYNALSGNCLAITDQMKLWLDDVRPAPPGWTWIRTVDEAIHIIAQGGVTEVSLDYNLTQSDPGRYGAEVLSHIYNIGDYDNMPVVHLHSASPFGAAHMSLFLRAIEGRCEPNPETLYELLDIEPQ